VAPVFWLLLIRWKCLPGKRPYLAIGLACFLHWLVLLQGIRLAHPALYLGWVALAFYMTLYPLLFIAMSRVAVHRCRVSLVIAAPVVWVGLELARGHMLSGFSMALLAHTQVRWTALIQISDIFGAYGVSFVIVFVAACFARMLPLWEPGSTTPAKGWSLWPVLALAVVLSSTLGYGLVRLGEIDREDESGTRLRIALIQASFDTIFELDQERDAEIFRRYLELSEQAITRHADLDLIVWPESAFTGELGEILVEEPVSLPEGIQMSPEEYGRRASAFAEAFCTKTRAVAFRLNHATRSDGQLDHNDIHMIVGTDTRCIGPGEPRRYNSALLIDPDGQVVRRYYKIHRVPFGEYILLGDTFPWLYRLTPMEQGLTPGAQPKVFEVAGARMAPSICFESTVPHLIRHQLESLRDAGTPVDLLVSVTNDGWFWGSSILDFHLACAVFRATENRLPMVVAANTGLSAHIDRSGRVISRGPRRGEKVILAEVATGPRHTWYQRLGDLPTTICLLFCLAVAVIGVAGRRSKAIAPKTAE
jgi:apolipoprotein N-acyltransferase